MTVEELIIQAAMEFGGYDADAETGEEYARVLLPQWVYFFNNSLKQLLGTRPDTHVKFVKTFQLTANETRHALPDDCVHFVNMTRNTGVAGATPGEPIKGPKTIEDLGVLDSGWHSDTGVTVMEFFAFNKKAPDVVWTYPRVHASTAVMVEIEYAYPFDEYLEDDISTDDIPVEAQFEQPLKMWMKKQAFEIDTDSLPDWNLSIRFEKSFYSSLGIEFQTGSTIAPQKERGND